MTSYNGTIELIRESASGTEKGKETHEYVGIEKDGRAPVYLQLLSTYAPAIIYRDWRDKNWKGTVMNYVLSFQCIQYNNLHYKNEITSGGNFCQI